MCQTEKSLPKIPLGKAPGTPAFRAAFFGSSGGVLMGARGMLFPPPPPPGSPLSAAAAAAAEAAAVAAAALLPHLISAIEFEPRPPRPSLFRPNMLSAGVS